MAAKKRKPRSAPFPKTFPVGTKKYYKNGQRHFAYDYLTPMGTDVLAVRDGTILDCQDGVASSTSTSNYSGEPSNWILLGYLNDAGDRRTIYYQHLSKGLLVKKGSKVKAGQKIAKSGNSGNSTGPHTHIAACEGWMNRSSRYQYMYDEELLIFPPDLCWAPTSL